MAEKKKGLGSAKRFGVRYGRTVKHKFANIEAEQKSKHKCPYCLKPKVSRISFGIWNCGSCNSKFAARAYTVGSKVNLVAETTQMVAEAPKLKSKKITGEED